jgi:hypothetical protein
MTPDETKAELTRLEELRQSIISTYVKLCIEVYTRLVPIVQALIPSLAPIAQKAAEIQLCLDTIDTEIQKLGGCADDT